MAREENNTENREETKQNRGMNKRGKKEEENKRGEGGNKRAGKGEQSRRLLRGAGIAKVGARSGDLGNSCGAKAKNTRNKSKTIRDFRFLRNFFQLTSDIANQ